jgi:hypothetical protein
MRRIWSPSHQQYVYLGGRLRPAQRSKIQLGDYLRRGIKDAPGISLPPAPTVLSSLQRAAMPSLRNVYLNQKYGCCVPAGSMHVRGVTSGNGSGLVTFSDSDVVALYKQMCPGFNPADSNTDQGCDEQSAFQTLIDVGWPDGTKLVGFAGLNGADPVLVRQALYAFENVVYGMELPDAWITPFPSTDGFVWDAGTPDPDNGHCIMGFGYDTTGINVDSWALFGTVTDAATAELTKPTSNGELYVLFTPDILAKAAQKSPDGFAYADLAADLKALQAA